MTGQETLGSRIKVPFNPVVQSNILNDDLTITGKKYTYMRYTKILAIVSRRPLDLLRQKKKKITMPMPSGNNKDKSHLSIGAISNSAPQSGLDRRLGISRENKPIV